MTGTPYAANLAPGAWKRYTIAEHTTRAVYLDIVGEATRLYLNGPFPDRDAYARTERDAWTRYYADSRGNWTRYVTEMEAELNPRPTDPYPVKGEAVTGTGWPQKLPVSEESAVWLQGGGGR